MIQTNVQKLREIILNDLKQKYITMITSTDDEFLAYQKRKELRIKTDKDDEDYNKAIQLYKEATEWYRNEKNKIAFTKNS